MERLGQGASGEVFLARPGPDLEISAPFVVLKRLRRDHADDRVALARFAHEAQLAVQVASPHIAGVYEGGAADETFYLVLEHVPGWTLSELLVEAATKKRNIPLEVCAGLLHGVLLGLSDLHGASDREGSPLEAVHRDLAPKNLMLREDGIVKIIDLGIGKSNLREWATKTGLVLGSPGYMAPEQVRAAEIDERTDLYAAATVAYELMTLRPFVPRGPTLEMLASVLDEREINASKYRKDLSPQGELWLKRALAFAPEDRFQNARSMREALQKWTPIASPSQIMAFVAELLGEKLAAQHERMQVWTDLPATLSEEVLATEIFARRVPPPQFSPLSPPPPITLARPRTRTLAVLGLFAVLISTVAMTVWVMSSSSARPAPVVPMVVKVRPAVEMQPSVPSVRISPRISAEDTPNERAAIPRTLKQSPRKIVDVPADSEPVAEIVPDPQSRVEALSRRLRELRGKYPENAAERQRLLELELDLSGSRSIEDNERLSRVLDRVENELKEISR